MGLMIGLILLLAFTVALIVLAFKRQKYRERQRRDTVGTYWTVMHMIIMLIVVAPICYVILGTQVLSLFEGNWLKFCVGIWALMVILIVYDLVFEFAEERIRKGNRSFADSIGKISKIESHLMNFLAVAGFYSSVIANELDNNIAGELNYYLLFGALLVFLDLVVLNVYESLYLLRGQEKPRNT